MIYTALAFTVESSYSSLAMILFYQYNQLT